MSRAGSLRLSGLHRCRVRQMHSVEIRDGRYVRKPEDLGPAPPPPTAHMPREAPGFHPVALPVACRDREHYPPTMLCVPAGKRYVHYCPTCGAKGVLMGRDVSC